MSRPAQRAGRSRARKPAACRQGLLTLSKLGARDRTCAVLKAFELPLV
ncbi:transcriptional regulator [Xanthomonas sp. WHRI 10064A]|nr:MULTISPECIES: transcriptional regulator [unclassified Xanthomonas]MEA9587544.1 transcriptional regulator [Xanthomonas sp. WHRI 10064B]MEA9615265.1 transcriptional regulator [Xanthomonas sp. WHRI 10064A]